MRCTMPFSGLCASCTVCAAVLVCLGKAHPGCSSAALPRSITTDCESVPHMEAARPACRALPDGQHTDRESVSRAAGELPLRKEGRHRSGGDWQCLCMLPLGTKMRWGLLRHLQVKPRLPRRAEIQPYCLPLALQCTATVKTCHAGGTQLCAAAQANPDERGMHL